MGTAGIKIKIMPSSTEADLKKIEEKAKIIIEEKGGKNCGFEEQPIAFGLKALIAFFELSEDTEPGEIEEILKNIEEVNSSQIIDMRRLM